MIDFVTITSQGQISIPAQFRKKFNLKAGDKLSVELDKTQLILKPVDDIAEKHFGILHDKASITYGKSPDEILALEDTAREGYITKKYGMKTKKK